MTLLKKAFNSVLEKLSQFLFKPVNLSSLGLMRIMLCGTLFYLACYRHINIDQFMDGSLVPRDEALSIFPEFYRPYITFFAWPDSWAAPVHLFLIGLYFLNLIGLSNRIVMLVTWAIAQGFIQRNYSVLFGADLIGNLFLFYLGFTQANEFYTVKDKLFSGRKFVLDSLTPVFFRLLQFQICIIYAYTGFEKLKGSTWWDGTALWTVLANPQFTNYDLIFLRSVPIFFATGTFITIIFEVYFAAMVANLKTRPYWLAAGVFFHLGIGILLSLMPFSLVMCSTYFLFINLQDHQQKIAKFFAKLSQFKTQIR